MAAPNRKLLGNTIAREQFLLNEARIMAQLRLEGMSADEAARKVKEENLFRYPTERSWAGSHSRATAGSTPSETSV